MRRPCLDPVRAALCALFAGAVLAAPASAGVPIMPLSEVAPGMQCTGLTVRSGLEPQSFDAQVISVYGAADPDSALILMRFSGPLVVDGGMAQGDSGSPISCPDPVTGAPEVIGGFSYGIGQYDNLVGGVTPIEAMLAQPTFGEAPAAPAIGEPSSLSKKLPAKQAKLVKATRKAKAKTGPKALASSPIGALRPSPTTYTLSGLRGPLAARFVSAAAKSGQVLRSAPTTRRAAVAPAGGLKAGDALAATAVTGDVSYSAIGTVTYVDGDKVYAFGHPFNGIGAARLLLERASINSLISSPTIGEQSSFKLGEAVGALGTIGFDGAYGIGGALGVTPAFIPTNVTVRNGAGQIVKTGGASVVDERSVRGGLSAQLVPLAAAANASGALQRLTRQASLGGAAHTCTTIFLKGQPVPLFQCSDAIVAVPDSEEGGVEGGVAEAVTASVSLATSAERFLRLIDRVQVDVTLRNEADDAQIVRIRQPKNVKAGSLATIRVVVIQGSTGERREVPVQVRIPKDAAGDVAGIVVLADPADASEGSSDDSIEALFATDDEDTGPAPKNLPALRKLYTGDGVSGLRAVVVPGLTGEEAAGALDGDTDASGLSEREVTTVQKQVKIVKEMPSVLLAGQASTTIRAR